MIRVLGLVALLAAATYGCTTMLVTSGASADGSVFVSHTNDGSAYTDPRLMFVPAADHESGSLRPIFASPENYPRYVGRDRGIPAYYPKPGQKAMEPIGFIPQVPHTFHYFEETYAAINEYQVGIGESTCSCIDWVAHGGKPAIPCANASQTDCALVSIDQLSQIALERATSAREAVQIIGQLAEEHGFYGEDSFEGSAESLLIGDKKEGWIFHVLPDPTGVSAVWAAQRVPDGHVTVVANMFVIRTVNLSNTDDFLGTHNMSEIAAKYGVGAACPSNDNCDFSGTFSDGEYAHKYYSGRRMWGAYRLMSPDLPLNATYNNLLADHPYPVTAPVDPLGKGRKISLADFMNFHRDHYEGTPYDMTQHMAAGPFGNPNRYAGGKGEVLVKGNWERAISIQRTSDSLITQSRAWLPDAVGGVLWFGPHVPHATSYTPFPSGSVGVPDEYSQGHQGALQRNTAFWAVRFVANLMELKFSYTRQDVADAQGAILNASLALLAKWEQQWATSQDVAALSADFHKNAQDMLVKYADLFDHLMFKYADGWVNEPILGAGVGYPAWWLSAVGYPDGPGPVTPPSAQAV